MLEKVFENKIKKLLKEKSAYYVKFFGCGITTAGTPDILACVNGHFLGIECKADNGRLSELQRLKLKAIQNSGGIGIVAAPCSWYDIVKLINCVSYGELDNARIIADTINSKWKLQRAIMEKNKLQVVIYSIHSDYKKLSVDFEKLKNLVTECLQNDSIEHHDMDIFNLIMDIDYHIDRIYVPLNDAYNDIFVGSKK